MASDVRRLTTAYQILSSVTARSIAGRTIPRMKPENVGLIASFQ